MLSVYTTVLLTHLQATTRLAHEGQRHESGHAACMQVLRPQLLLVLLMLVMLYVGEV